MSTTVGENPYLTDEGRRAIEQMVRRRTADRIEGSPRRRESSDTLTLRRIAIEQRRQAQRLLAARAGRGR